MVRISKKQTSNKVLAIMGEQFAKHIARLSTVAEAESFFKELFTATERVLYMKRFAVLIMLERGYSFSVIKKVLQVSQTTISRIQRERKGGCFDHTVSYIERKRRKPHARHEQESNFITFLEGLLEVVMLPQGKGRWKYIWDIMERDERRRQERLREKAKRK